MSPDDVLERLVARVEADPQGGDSLVLYALASTLRMDKSGYLFLLRKLRDLSPEGRLLAYDLMEFMARGGNAGPAWEAALQALDRAIRGGPADG
ncbi:MAG TPA: hypothetical protein ENK12_08845 [Gammaproteobacteria bacterium]|nr:hypothetical protein [Gammaproteobacteria bacterium]